MSASPARGRRSFCSAPIGWDALGQVHARRRALDAALEAFERAVDLAPDSPVWRANRAAVRLARGDATGALEDVARALVATPGEPTLLGTRASALAGLGRLDEAHGELRRALEASPEDGRLWSNLAKLELARGRGDDALVAAVRAVERLPRDPTPWVHRARALEALDRPDEAAAAVEQALARDPDHVPALGLSAVQAARRGDLDGAEAALVRVTTLAPGSSHGWQELTKVRLQRRDGAGALAASARLLELEGEQVDALFLRAAALEQAGRPEEARPVLRRFLERARPDDPRAARARRLLEAPSR